MSERKPLELIPSQPGNIARVADFLANSDKLKINRRDFLKLTAFGACTLMGLFAYKPLEAKKNEQTPPIYSLGKVPSFDGVPQESMNALWAELRVHIKPLIRHQITNATSEEDLEVKTNALADRLVVRPLVQPDPNNPGRGLAAAMIKVIDKEIIQIGQEQVQADVYQTAYIDGQCRTHSRFAMLGPVPEIAKSAEEKGNDISGLFFADVNAEGSIIPDYDPASGPLMMVKTNNRLSPPTIDLWLRNTVTPDESMPDYQHYFGQLSPNNNDQSVKLDSLAYATSLASIIAPGVTIGAQGVQFIIDKSAPAPTPTPRPTETPTPVPTQTATATITLFPTCTSTPIPTVALPSKTPDRTATPTPAEINLAGTQPLPEGYNAEDFVYLGEIKGSIAESSEGGYNLVGAKVTSVKQKFGNNNSQYVELMVKLHNSGNNVIGSRVTPGDGQDHFITVRYNKPPDEIIGRILSRGKGLQPLSIKQLPIGGNINIVFVEIRNIQDFIVGKESGIGRVKGNTFILLANSYIK